MAIAVSTAWKEAIQAQFRYPAYIRLTLNVQPPGLREGAQVSTNATESITSTDTIFDGVQTYADPVATFEQDRWIGDGSMYLSSETKSLNKPMEWWSNTCDFSSVELTLIFDQAYSIPGMFVTWDTETNSWPTNLQLKGYKQDGTLIGTYNITSINSVEGYFDAAFDDCKQVVMTITEWSKPNWRVRINEIVCGLYMRFNNDQIPSASLSASADLLAAELPKLSVKFTINNYDQTFDPLLKEGYSRYLAERQVAEVAWGFSVDSDNVEWMDSWPLYLSAWKIPTDSPTVEITTTSRLSFLTTEYNKGTYNGARRTFASMATTVFQNSGIIQNSDTETPWELDAIMSTLYTRAPEPVENVNAVLQLIANATGCIMDNNPENNYVRFRSACVDAGYTIQKLQQMGDPSFTIEDRLKSVSVNLYTFSQRSEAEKVYSFEGHVAGSSVLDVKFDGDAIVVNPVATISGATITSQVYYARRAKITIVAAAAGADVTLTINGIIVDESTTTIQTYNNPDVVSGQEVVIDNPLITEMATLQHVAEVTKNFYLRRKTVNIPYTGYPELETGDTLGFVTNYGEFDGDVTDLTLEFNGGFDGTLSVRAKEESA